MYKFKIRYLIFALICIASSANAFGDDNNANDWFWDGDFCYKITSENTKEVSVVDLNAKTGTSDGDVPNLIIPETITYDAISYSVTGISYEPHRTQGIGDYMGVSSYQYGCRAITLPKTIKTINPIWMRCFLSKLEEVILDNDNENFAVKDGVVYSKDFTELVYCPTAVKLPENELAFTVAAGVKKIGAWAFGGVQTEYATRKLSPAGINKIKQYILPEGLLNIDDAAFGSTYWLDKQEDSEYNNPIEINIPQTVERIGNNCFYNSNLPSEFILDCNLKELGYGAFSNARGITKLTINANLDSLPERFIYFSWSLNEIVINSEVEKISNRAFAGCYNLETVKLPASIKEIGEMAFSECNALIRVDLPQQLEIIGDYAFGNCQNLIKVEFPAQLSVIGKGAFYECTKLSGIEIPSKVSVIDDLAFYHCSSLGNMSFPTGELAIGERAFAKCNSLIDILIPSQNLIIKSGAFSECDFLKTISLPKSCSEIWDQAFANCKQLKSITISGHERYIASDFVSNNPKLEEIKENEEGETYKVIDGILYCQEKTLMICPPLHEIESLDIKEGVTTINDRAFADNLFIQRINFPKSLSTIGIEAFKNCKNLRIINAPERIKQLGHTAFYGCESLLSNYNLIPTGILSGYAFAGCKSLSTIILPYGLKIAEQYALFNCDGAKFFIVPPTYSYIENMPQYGFIKPGAIFSCSGDMHGVFLYTDNISEKLDFMHVLQDTPIYVYPDRLPKFVNASDDQFLFGWYNNYFAIDQSFALIDIASLTANIGEQYQLHVWCNINDYSPSAQSYPTRWYSENPSIAAVDNNGLVTAVGIGQTVIRYLINIPGGKTITASSEITVDGESGVENIDNFNDNSEIDEIFSISGVKVGNSIESLSHGIYIVRTGNKSKKIKL